WTRAATRGSAMCSGAAPAFPPDSIESPIKASSIRLTASPLISGSAPSRARRSSINAILNYSLDIGLFPRDEQVVRNCDPGVAVGPRVIDHHHGLAGLPDRHETLPRQPAVIGPAARDGVQPAAVDPPGLVFEQEPAELVDDLPAVQDRFTQPGLHDHLLP